MPLSFTLPATMPENARRRLAASSWAGRSRLQIQVAIVFVGRIERPLEAFVDLQQPVELERVVALAAELFAPP